MSYPMNTGRAGDNGGAKSKPGGTPLSASSPKSAQGNGVEHGKSPSRSHKATQSPNAPSPSKSGQIDRRNAVIGGSSAASRLSECKFLSATGFQTTSAGTDASSSVRAQDQEDLAERNRKAAQEAREADQEDMALPVETENEKKKRLKAAEKRRKEEEKKRKKQEKEDEKKRKAQEKEEEKRRKEQEKADKQAGGEANKAL